MHAESRAQTVGAFAARHRDPCLLAARCSQLSTQHCSNKVKKAMPQGIFKWAAGARVVVLLLFLLALTCVSGGGFDDYDLPLFPPGLAESPNPYANDTNGKLVPRHIWITFRDVPPRENMTAHLQRMLVREEAKNWTFHLCSNEAQAALMEQYFHNTSILWAFKMINPRVGNAASDIFRYCVLYLFGGVYMDDDSYIESNFDNIIGKNDSLIVSKEFNAYQDDCYHMDNHLSLTYLINKYNCSEHKNTITDIFGGRSLVSWALFAAPRNPLFKRTLENVVHLLKHEYLRKSLVLQHPHEPKYKIVMCTTGPVIMTATLRELVLADEASLGQYRIEKRDFVDWGGSFKLIRGHDDRHYMFAMGKYMLTLLKTYVPIATDKLEDSLVTCDRKEFFLFKNGSLHGFRDFDHFREFGRFIKSATVLDEIFFNTLQKGDVAVKGVHG